MDAARAGIATLGTKTPEVPGFMPALNSAEDLQVLLRQPITTREFTGVILPLHVADLVLKKTGREDLQSSLVVGQETWGNLKQRGTVLVDPVPELFYLTRPVLRGRIASLPGAPPAFFAKMFKNTPDTHAKNWRRALNDGSFVASVDWIMKYELNKGAEVVLPMTPFVEGQSKATVDLALSANDIAARILNDGDHLPGLYFSINYRVFRKEDLAAQLIAGIRKLVLEKAPHLIAIRLRDLPQAERDDDELLWATLQGFLTAVGGIASEYGVAFALLNSGTHGYAALQSGVDFFSEPPSGNIKDPFEEDPIRKKKGFAKGLIAGKIYHPEYKINYLRVDYEAALISEKGFPSIPCSSAPNPNLNAHEFRRQAKHYRIAARCEEARKFKVAIRNNERRALPEEFARSRARNAERLLHNPM